MHAATKYIGGHSDILMGLVACNEAAWPKVFEVIGITRQTTTADDVYLAFRGLHTMKARIEAQTSLVHKILPGCRNGPKLSASCGLRLSSIRGMKFSSEILPVPRVFSRWFSSPNMLGGLHP